MDPDEVTTRRSRKVVRPVTNDRLAFRPEVVRKSIHFASIILPIAVWLLPAPIPLLLLATGAVAALVVEFARNRSRWARFHFLRRTRRLLRTHERSGIAGATWMAIAYLIAYLVFPLPVAVAAMLYNGVGDALAAVVGKRWGRHRLRSGKSWEGTATAFLADFAIGVGIPGIGVIAAVVGAAGAALIEIAPLRIDDNLRVTLFGGMVLWIALGFAVA